MNNRRMRNRAVAILLCTTMLCACGGQTPAAKDAAGKASVSGNGRPPGAEDIVAGQTAEAADSASLLTGAAAELPDAVWQKDVTFPDWKGYVDDTLAMNGMVSFRGYRDQGVLYITPSAEVTGFQLYVNGREADTSGMKGGQTWRVDLKDAAVNGTNTIQVSGIEPYDPVGKVRVSIPYPVVIDAAQDASKSDPSEREGIAAESLQLISDIIEADVEQGFPGAQLAVIRNGKLVYANAWGSTRAYLSDGSRNPDRSPVTNDTLFDLASVTKMFSVNYAMQKLVTDGKVLLDDRAADYLGERFYTSDLEESYLGDIGAEEQRAMRERITVRDLLTHQSGFSGDPRYYLPFMDYKKAADAPGNVNQLYAGSDGSPETKEATIDAICRTPLKYEPGTKIVYSDLNYILLGVIVETVTGQDLNTYLKETFWDPMGLSRITYRPLDHGFTAADCAATELQGNTRDGEILFPGARTDTVQGEVHDELAWYSMGGISGHAGLFADAADLAKLASVMLTGGYGEHRFFSQNVMDSFTAPKKEDATNWGIGWYREGDDQRVWYFGTGSDPDTVGHQGWTGTLVMIDPSRDLVVVYLTNKVHSGVTAPEENLNKFDGGYYTASTLGFVPQILSVGMDGDGDVNRQLALLAADMVKEEERLLADDVWVEHPLVKSLRGRLTVLRKWADRNGTDADRDRALALADAAESDIRYVSEPDPALIERSLAGMDTKKKIAQMLMPSIRSWGEGGTAEGVTVLNAELAEAVEQYGFGGVILFAQNIESAEQTAKLTASLQEANRKGGASADLLISVDQEGGSVTRIATGTQMPGNMALGATGDSGDAKKAAQVIGEELKALGINVDFAPVLDVNNDPANPIIGIRSFSDDPATVGTFGKAYQSGLHSRGVMTALKHFPGHGDTSTDSHTGLPLIDKSLEELERFELVPYAGNLRRADIVMTAHIRYPQIEKETYVSKKTGEKITLPATLSRTILTDLLRGELHFDGVITTDAMDMDAVSAHFDPIDAAKLAINAGVDLILMPVSMQSEQGIRAMGDYIDSLAESVESGEIPQERIDESVTRILKLKARYGLLDGAAEASGDAQASAAVGSKAHHATEWEIAKHAVTLLKNEEELLPLTGTEKVVIACPYQSQIHSGEYALKRLAEDGLLPEDADVRVVCYSDQTASEAAGLTGGADTVIGISALYSAAELDPSGEEGAGAAFLDALIAETHQAGGRFILLSAQLPYDTARYQEADAILACYNAKGMPELPDDNGAAPQYGPNVPAALYTILGGRSPRGKLPVNIPKLSDKDYGYTDETLYARGFGLSSPQRD